MDTSLSTEAITGKAIPSEIKAGRNAEYARDSSGVIMNGVFDIASNSAL